MEKLFWHPNTFLMPHSAEQFRCYQVRFRRNLLVDSKFVPLISKLKEGMSDEDFKSAYDSLDRPSVRDATENKLWDHSYRNPDNFVAETDEPAPSGADEVIELLLEHQFLNRGDRFEFDLQKKGMADRFKGNFYEQIGTECLLNRRMPEDWWVEQKFEKDLLQTRPTPYRFIQDKFLEKYFGANLKGHTALEIGSGTGYYTQKIAPYVKKMVGIDYNPDYVKKAQDRWPAEKHTNLSFEVGDILDVAGLSERLGGEKFDFVIMIDTFLFLFDEAYQIELYKNRNQIIQNMGKLLKPDGRMLIMDPHPLWLTPWFGTEEAPFGILTEYREREFKVIPSLEEITQLFCDNGLRIRRVMEPTIQPEYKDIDPVAFAFMKKIPQWWFFELEVD